MVDRASWENAFRVLLERGYEPNKPGKLLKLNSERVQAAVLYRSNKSSHPIHLHPGRIDSKLIDALRPHIIRSDRKRDSNGWDVYNVTNWRGLVAVLPGKRSNAAFDATSGGETLEIAIKRMAATARATTAAANGQKVSRRLKNKDLRFADGGALERHLEELEITQGGRCALTAISFDRAPLSPDLLRSLDRIDSNGHYERGNLQLVCRFMNRWKGSDNNASVRELIALLRNHQSTAKDGR